MPDNVLPRPQQDISHRVLCAIGSVLLLFAILLWTTGPATFAGMDLSDIQLLAFPLIAFFLWRLPLFGLYAARTAIILGVCSAAAAVSYSYLYLRDAPLSFVVARLSDDEFEASTRQFREAINRKLKALDAPRLLVAQRSHESFKSHHEAEKFLDKSEFLPLAVWGRKHWITISLHPFRTASLEPEVMSVWLRRTGLKPVLSVPVVGLTFAPESATAEFIAGTFSAVLLAREGERNLPWVQSELLRTATQQAPWTSFAHRGYAWWVLGNLSLMEATRGGRYEAGELRCAIQYYTNARNSLKSGDNPELLAAALNNRSIAQAIMAVAEQRKDLRRSVRAGLKAAAASLSQRNLYGVTYRAGKVARLNFRALRSKGLLKSRHLKKRDSLRRKKHGSKANARKVRVETPRRSR